MTMGGNTSPVKKSVSTSTACCMDLASSVNTFQGDMGPALSYWKPAKKVATHDPVMKNKATYDPVLGELE